VEKQPGRLFVVSWLLFIPLIVLCFLPFVYLVAADSPSAWVFMVLWWVPLLPLALVAYGLTAPAPLAPVSGVLSGFKR
jgi:hypothetical protein